MSRTATAAGALDLAPDGAAPAVTVGIDAVSVPRVRALLGGGGFAASVFRPAEIAYCGRHRDPAPHFAARFCAKEAALKALGDGLGVPAAMDRLREVEVVRDGGPPRLTLHGRLASRARRRGAAGASVSLSHTSEFALAHVQVVWKEDRCDCRG